MGKGLNVELTVAQRMYKSRLDLRAKSLETLVGDTYDAIKALADRLRLTFDECVELIHEHGRNVHEHRASE